jgi:tetratricopeptide (TPR) repeat protein
MSRPQNQSLGEFLVSLRQLAGKTQEELAGDAGLSARSISDLERDRVSRPRRRSLELLAAALNLEPTHTKALVAIARRAPGTNWAPAGEPGVEPGTELIRLYQRILATRGDVAGAQAAANETALAAPVTPRQLPAATRNFAGRAGDLAALDELLEAAGRKAQGTVVISAVGGTAGVGKTALAVYWAHQVAHRFRDGQLYVNLRGFDPSAIPVTPAEAVRGFLDALGVPSSRIPQDLAAQVGLYRSLLAGRQMLIVLDNARDEQQVRSLLPADPGCLVIVTSRNQMAGLAAADGARLLTLDVLSHAEARQLLDARLGDRATAEPDAADEIVRLCAQLPLALAIAAAHAAARSRLLLADLAAMLRDGRGRLDALDTSDPTMTVRTVFTWSVRQLGPEAVRMFRLLGLHPGPDISVPAAASMAGLTLPAARRALWQLTTASLLTEHVPGRYAFHDLLRAYATEQAEAADDGEARRTATGRMLDHYLHTACTATLLLSPSRLPVALAPARPRVTPEHFTSHQLALDWFKAECQVLLAAIALAAETGFDLHAWQLPWTMTVFLNRQGRWHEWAATGRTALDAATRLGDTAGQAVTQRLLAVAYGELGNYDQAAARLTESLGLCRQLGDRAIEAQVHQTLCWLLGRQDHYLDALGHAERALGLLGALGDRAGQAAALNNVGCCHAQAGDYERARTFCQQALTLYRDLRDLRHEASAWDSLGYVEHHLGNLTEAAVCYQRALRLFRQTGDRYGQAVTLTRLGDACHADDPHQARDAWMEALDILNELHHPDAAKLRHKLRQP